MRSRSSSRLSPRLARHAEAALGDDVLLDLRGAAADDQAELEHVLDLPVVASSSSRLRRRLVEQAELAQRVDRERAIWWRQLAGPAVLDDQLLATPGLGRPGALGQAARRCVTLQREHLAPGAAAAGRATPGCRSRGGRRCVSLCISSTSRAHARASACSGSPSMLRSCFSVALATYQPSPRCPRRSVAGTRTSVKNTSLNSARPVMVRQRPHLDARRRHREQQVGDARACFGSSGSVRHQAEHHVGVVRRAGPDLLAVDDEVSPSSTSRASARRRGRCPRPAPSSPGTRSPRRGCVGPIQRCFCSSRAELEQRRHQHARCPGSPRPARRPARANSSAMMRASRTSGSAP